METAFVIIAEPNRRAILSLLASSERCVGDIERQLRMPQPTVSKHLRVLREAGFVESRTEAQRRLYRLRPEPLKELDDWLVPFRRFWSRHVDALEKHLDRMEKVRPAKGRKKNMSSRDQYEPGAASGADDSKGWRQVDARSGPRAPPLACQGLAGAH